jgi:transposase
MIDAERWAEVRRLYRAEGCKLTAIARRLGLDRKTVRRVLDQTTFTPARATPRRGSIVDPFREKIHAWLEQADLSAVQVHARLLKEGYQGEITLVRDCIREVRKKQERAFLKLSFLPGECAQVDWAYMGSVRVGRTRRRLSAFVMILAYSRLMYIELTLSECMDAFLEAHARAFQYFGGAPARLLYDCCRTVVLQRSADGIRFHPRLLAFADHYLFAVRACPPRRPWHKGRVESGIRYVRANFERGRGPVADLERERRDLAEWRDETANQRLHSVTRRKPRELFEEVERATLRRLPERPCETDHFASVSVNKSYRISFDGNSYTVPFELAHAPALVLKATTTEVRIFKLDVLVARHDRTYDRGVDVRDEAHDRRLRERHRRADRDMLLARLVSLLGAEAERYAAGLARSHVRAPHHVRRIIALVERYGVADVREALLTALAHDAYGADYLENLVHQDRRRRLAGPALLPPVLRDEQFAAVMLLAPDLDRFDSLFAKGADHAREGQQQQGIQGEGEEGRAQGEVAASGGGGGDSRGRTSAEAAAS